MTQNGTCALELWSAETTGFIHGKKGLPELHSDLHNTRGVGEANVPATSSLHFTRTSRGRL